MVLVGIPSTNIHCEYKNFLSKTSLNMLIVTLVTQQLYGISCQNLHVHIFVTYIISDFDYLLRVIFLKISRQ